MSDVQPVFLKSSIVLREPIGGFTAADIEAANEITDRILDDVDAQIALALGRLPPIPSRTMRRKLREQLPADDAERIIAWMQAQR